MANPVKKSKLQKIQQLIKDIRGDDSCSRINPPLINQFSIHEKIPNRWFDWENRVNSPIMIIGQDWGPYIHLKKYIDDPSQDHFASSRTENFIINALDAIDPRLIDTVFFTVSVIFTRTGSLFRGSQNYNEAKSFEISYPYVSRQIDIVKPQAILTMGALAIKVVDRHFRLGLRSKKLSQIVDRGEINTGTSLIIPAYHPAAFVSPKVQLGAWKRLGTLILKSAITLK
jgi:uracil-DNA glycosylase